MTNPVLRFDEVQPEARVSLAAWEGLHLGACALMVCSAEVALFWEGNWDNLLPGAGYAFMACTMLFLARVLRTMLQDILGQFGYREKFATAMVHLAAMTVPWFFFGARGWDHPLSVLLMLLCGQGVSRVGFGRIYAVAGFIAFKRIMQFPYPPFWMIACWLLGFLLALRFEHVRFRLEECDAEDGTPLKASIRETLASVVAPWSTGLACWFGLGILLRNDMKRFEFKFDPKLNRNPIGPVSIGSVLWDAIILVAIVILSLLALAWIEKQLRSRKKGETLKEDFDGTIYESRVRNDVPLEESVAPAPETSARGRIIARFREFSETLSRLGWGRGTSETAAEYLARLRGLVGGDAILPDTVRGGFEAACYSELEITEAQAGAFNQVLREAEPELRDGIARAEARARLDAQALDRKSR